VTIDDYRESPRLWRFSRGVGIGAGGDAPVASLPGGGRFSFLGRLVPPQPDVAYTRFTLELRTEGLIPRRDGRGVVVRATSFDQDRRRIRYWPHAIFDQAPADMDWQRIGTTVPWAPPVAMMRLEIANLAAGGRVEVRRVTIEPLVDAAWYPHARLAVIAAWVCLCGIAAAVVLRRLRPRGFAAALSAATAGLLLAAILPQPLFDRLAGPFEEPLIAMVRGASALVPYRAPPAPPRPPPETPAPAAPGEAAPPAAVEAPAAADRGGPDTAPPAADDQAAPATAATVAAEAIEMARDGASWLRRLVEGNTLHAAGFGVLALIAVGLARLPFLPVACALAGVAAATEALQLLTITRDADLGDIAVDATGAILGVLAGLALRRLLAYRRSSAPPGPHPAG